MIYSIFFIWCVFGFFIYPVVSILIEMLPNIKSIKFIPVIIGGPLVWLMYIFSDIGN